MKTIKGAALGIAAVVCMLLMAAEVAAWAPGSPQPSTFEVLDTVTEVSLAQPPASYGVAVTIVGTAVGDPTPVTWSRNMGDAAALACQRAAALVMARPGRFHLRLDSASGAGGCVLVAQ